MQNKINIFEILKETISVWPGNTRFDDLIHYYLITCLFSTYRW